MMNQISRGMLLLAAMLLIVATNLSAQKKKKESVSYEFTIEKKCSRNISEGPASDWNLLEFCIHQLH